MVLSIKNPVADRLARELARRTGETLTDAVVQALRERLVRESGRRDGWSLRTEIDRIQERVSSLPVLDERTLDELIGYDEDGLPG